MKRTGKQVTVQPRFVAILTAGVIVFCQGLFSTAAPAETIPVSRFSAAEGLSGWQTKSFKGMTEYRLVADGERTVVRADSARSASGLVREIRFSPMKYQYLNWSWKIAATVKGGNENVKSGDDCAARLYVVFPGRFFWQTRAVCYIWANTLEKGGRVVNPYTGNVRMIAVESGNSSAGMWLSETRDLRADYRLLFGDDPPEARAVAIMTDTDNTGGSATAWYGDIILSTEK